jgi:ankyrin repeat protein
MNNPQTSGSAASPLSHAQPVDPEWEAAQQDVIKPFVIASHADLAAVKAGLRSEPQLANARLYLFDEAPIEAAAHVGRADIAHYLLGSGAPLTVHAAAMLGLRPTLEAYLQRDASLATRPGAHGIPMMFHAALSGDIEVCELLAGYSGNHDYSAALHAAVHRNRLPLAQWLLDRGATLDALDYLQRTPLAAAEALGQAEMAALLRSAGAT